MERYIQTHAKDIWKWLPSFVAQHQQFFVAQVGPAWLYVGPSRYFPGFACKQTRAVGLGVPQQPNPPWPRRFRKVNLMDWGSPSTRHFSMNLGNLVWGLMGVWSFISNDSLSHWYPEVRTYYLIDISLVDSNVYFTEFRKLSFLRIAWSSCSTFVLALHSPSYRPTITQHAFHNHSSILYTHLSQQ